MKVSASKLVVLQIFLVGSLICQNFFENINKSNQLHVEFKNIQGVPSKIRKLMILPAKPKMEFCLKNKN